MQTCAVASLTDPLAPFAGLGEYISGSILFEETLYDKAATGEPFVELMKKQGIIPGIKTDKVCTSLCAMQDLWMPRTIMHSHHALPLTSDRCCLRAAALFQQLSSAGADLVSPDFAGSGAADQLQRRVLDTGPDWPDRPLQRVLQAGAALLPATLRWGIAA